MRIQTNLILIEDQIGGSVSNRKKERKKKKKYSKFNFRKYIFADFLISGEGPFQLGFAHISDSHIGMRLL